MLPEVEVDVGVIGAGPGGYHAAIRAAQLGANVALIEKDEVGGVCLNKGCIPTKALLESTKLLAMIERSGEFGLSVSGFSVKLPAIRAKMEKTVKKLVTGLRYLIDSYGIKMVKGVGTPISPRMIKVVKDDERIEHVRCKNIVIATGSTPTKITSNGGRGIINTDDALQLEEPPRSIIILGSNMVGLEFAYIFNKLGTEVTVIERAPHILPSEDREVALQLQRILTNNNIKVLAGARVLKIDERESEMTVIMKDLKKELTADGILLTERKPNFDNLGLMDLGVRVEEGRIFVNEHMETSVKGVYAIGDVTGGTFAHVAFAEGIVAAENIMQKEVIMDHRLIPRCIYITPEIASVGLTEEQARGRGHDIKIGRFPLAASARALTLGERRGFVKIIADAKSGEILGVHIIGPRASDLIAETTLAMKFEITVDELADVIHVHPTLSEAIKEAALAVCKRSIHLPPTQS